MSKSSLLLTALVLTACAEEASSNREFASQFSDELILFDDFEEGPLDAVYRWQAGETRVATVQGGELVLGARSVHHETPGTPGESVVLRTPEDTPITRIEADLRVVEHGSIAAGARAFLGLSFQPEEDRGTSANLLGVRVGMQTDQARSLGYWLTAFHCQDAACTATYPVEIEFNDFPQGATIDASGPHHLSIAYDSDEQRLVVAIDEYAAFIDTTTIAGFDPENVVFGEVRAQAYPAQQHAAEGVMLAHFDNVLVDGFAYDTFDGDRIDTTRWWGGDFVRELRDGALVLAAGRSIGHAGTNISLRDTEGVHELAANVRLLSASFDGDTAHAPTAQVGGFFYNDGAGEDPQATTGLVWASSDLRLDCTAHWQVTRCENEDCSEQRTLGEGPLEGDGDCYSEPVALYVAWNGTHFTFQRGEGMPSSFHAVAAGAAAEEVSLTAPKALRVYFPPHYPEGVPGWLEAAFDDVHTDTTGKLKIGQGEATETWISRGGPLSQRSAIVFGEDPYDTNSAVLLANVGALDSGSCEDRGPDCRYLRISLPLDRAAPYTTGQAYAATASWWDGSRMASGTGNVSFDQFRAFAGTARGAFVIDVEGTSLQGTFSAPWVPSASTPPQAAISTRPVILGDQWCTDSPQCDHQTPADRTTRFQWTTQPGRAYAVRATGAVANVKLQGSSGATLCAQEVSEHEEVVCRATADGGHLYVETEGRGEAGQHVLLSMSRDFTELSPGSWDTYEVEVGDSHWFRVRGPVGTHGVTLEANDTASAGISVYQRNGWWEFGNGYCCGPDNYQQYLAPERTGDLWFLMDVSPDQSWVPFTGSSHSFDLHVEGIDDGSTPFAAMPVDVRFNGYQQANLRVTPDAPVYLSVRPPESGVFLPMVEVMDWGEHPDPVDFLIFSNASDPEGSALRTEGGTDCEGKTVTYSWGEALQANCYALLEADTTYYLRLSTTSEGVGPLTGVRLEHPNRPSFLVDLPISATRTNAPGEVVRIEDFTEPGRGYNLIVTPSNQDSNNQGVSFGLMDMTTPSGDCFYFCWRDLGGMGTWIESLRVGGLRRFALSLTEDYAPLYLSAEVGNYTGAQLGYTVQILETGSGLSQDSPIDMPDPQQVHQDGFLRDHTDHYYTFTATNAGGSLFLDVPEWDTGNGPWPGGWQLYREDTSGGWSLQTLCPASTTQARCNYTSTHGTRYLLRINHGDVSETVRYTMRGE